MSQPGRARHRPACGLARSWARLAWGAAQATVLLAGSLHAQEADPRQDENSVQYTVSRPTILIDAHDPHLGATEGNLFVLRRGPGDYLGYIVSGRGGTHTVILKGKSIETLAWSTSDPVIDSNPVAGSNYCGRVDPLDWQQHFDDCGAWIRFVDRRSDGSYVAFFHAETNCCYAHRQTFFSTGMAFSNDGLVFHNLLGRPFLPQNLRPAANVSRGISQISAVRHDPFYYIFFDYRTGRAPALVRVPVDDLALDRAEKFLDGRFVSIHEDEGNYQPLKGQHGVSPGYDDQRNEFYLVGPSDHGIFVSRGSSPDRMTRIDAPLVPSLGRDVARTIPISTPSDASRSAIATDGSGVLIGYGFAQTYRDLIKDHQASLARLVDCRRPDGTIRLRWKACGEAEEKLGTTLPFAFEPSPSLANEPGLSPISICPTGTRRESLTVEGADRCPPGQGEVVAYLASQAAGEYFGNASLVGLDGGNHFRDGFYLFYNFTRPGDTRALRDVVWQKVTVSEAKAGEPSVKAELALYQAKSAHLSSVQTWVTSGPVDASFTFVDKLGFVATSDIEDGIKLVDCVTAGALSRHVLRPSSCGGDETPYKLVGWTYKTPHAFTMARPLSVCIGRSDVTYGVDGECPTGTERQTLGFPLR